MLRPSESELYKVSAIHCEYRTAIIACIFEDRRVVDTRTKNIDASNDIVSGIRQRRTQSTRRRAFINQQTQLSRSLPLASLRLLLRR